MCERRDRSRDCQVFIQTYVARLIHDIYQGGVN